MNYHNCERTDNLKRDFIFLSHCGKRSLRRTKNKIKITYTN